MNNIIVSKSQLNVTTNALKLAAALNEADNDEVMTALYLSNKDKMFPEEIDFKYGTKGKDKVLPKYSGRCPKTNEIDYSVIPEGFYSEDFTLYGKYDKTFWELIKGLEWKNLVKLWHNGELKKEPYRVINLQLRRMKFDTIEISHLGDIVNAYKEVLKQTIIDFNKKNYPQNYFYLKLSDDSFEYFANHIVGLGYEVYNAIYNHPQIAVGFAENRKWTEGFNYSFN